MVCCGTPQTYTVKARLLTLGADLSPSWGRTASASSREADPRHTDRLGDIRAARIVAAMAHTAHCTYPVRAPP